MNPTVSIIVPVYNAAKPFTEGKTSLHRCIDSILNQEYTDFELILLDDGSKDDSPKILDDYANVDHRIKVIHKPNTGVSNTRNLGMSSAKGKYIQFLDADDWMTTDATKTLVRSIEEAEADMVIADFYRVVGNNTSHKGRIDTDKVLTKEEFAEYMIQSPADYYYGVLWNKLYKKDIIDTYHIQMDENLSWAEDFIFNLEYLLHVNKIIPLQLPIYYYVKTEGSLVSQNVDIRSTVDMKLSVIKYYDQFYKSIYDEKEYSRKRAEILGFLLNFASDESAFSFSPVTKKLGEEILPLAKLTSPTNDILVQNYYTTKLLERLLQRIATASNISFNELRIIHYFYRFLNTSVDKQMSLFTDINSIVLVTTVERLTLNGYLTRTTVKTSPAIYTVSSKADQIVKYLESLDNDFNAIRFQNIDLSTQEQFLSIEDTIFLNIYHKLF